MNSRSRYPGKRVSSAAVATGQLHLPLALAARKLSPLQRAFTSEGAER